MTRGLEAIGIDVSAELLAQWATWFAPEHQPFLLSADSSLARAGHALDSSMTLETRDTFEIYSLPDGIVCRGISYEEFMALPREDRAELVRAQRALGRSQVPSVRAWPFIRPLGTAKQADDHRFVWWPTLLKGLEHEVLIPYIEEGRRASRHRKVDEQVWAEASVLLPHARALAAKVPARQRPELLRHGDGRSGRQRSGLGVDAARAVRGVAVRRDSSRGQRRCAGDGVGVARAPQRAWFSTLR